MSKSLIGASLLFSEPNCPTREGELIKSLSDMENIPAPYLGMKVFVEDEGKCFFVSKLKAKVVDGVPVADAVVAELLPFGGTKKVVWSNDSAPLSNMNDFTTAGVYELSGEHTRIDDNLPIANTGSGHTFNARLTVLDSSIPDTTNSDDKCITQLLAFSNRLGQGEVYIRTGKGMTLDSLTWDAWSTLQRNVNVGQVENLDDFVDNGIYSGVWLTGSHQSYPLTFVCIVINDYFIKTGTRRISQFIYGLSKFDGSTEFKCRIKEEGKDWDDWEIINKKEISKMIKDVTDGIDPDKIDSIKDIISWIEKHGGEVTAIYNAINNLSTLITEETTRAESSEQALDDKINDEIERAKAAEKSIDDKLANIDVLDGIKDKVVAIDGMDVVYQSDDVDIEFDTLGDNRNNITIGAATENTAGVMSAKDKKKLNRLSEGGGVAGDAQQMVNVTYSELVALRNNNELVAGMKYRITDYVTTTVQFNTKSANHPFDVIVEAVSENELSELAQAIQHEGDTYFDGNDLGAWQLWYDLNNDTDKYEWADATNGKGVIYRMIDEKRNDCPYDFKNILFYNNEYTTNTTSDKYYYTFSYVVNGVLYDGTVETHVTTGCHSNNMGVYFNRWFRSLNKNTFRNIAWENTTYNNTFSKYCHNNTFGKDCCNNTFGENCTFNTFGNECSNNVIGYKCYNNKFGESFHDNTIGNLCQSNKFTTSSYYNNIGNQCAENYFDPYFVENRISDFFKHNTAYEDVRNNTIAYNCCYNRFYPRFQYNVIREFCENNVFEADCKHNVFGYDFARNHISVDCSYNIFGDNCYENIMLAHAHNTIVGNRVIAYKEIEGEAVYSDFLYERINYHGDKVTTSREYFHDGTGKLVPIKHPDLSTQPSILPYKFMGNYVYEQLIPVMSASRVQPLVDLAINKPAFLSANTLGLFATSNVDIQGVNNDFILLKDTLNPDIHKYIKVTYIDGVQLIGGGEESYGYGYSNSAGSTSSDIELIYDFGISSDDTGWVYEKSSDTLTLDKSGILSQDSIPDNYKNSKNVTIQNSVTSIENEAFYDCSSLTSIEIPNSVISIGEAAFAYCTSLTNIEIPNSVTSIEYSTFADCSSLTSITIPNSVTSIDF